VLNWQWFRCCAKAWAVPEVYGIAASVLGDDRLARALDAVADNVDVIVGAVGARLSTTSVSM
jgi:hypothetical protein